MKKLLFILPLIISIAAINAQEYTGIHTSNYFPLQNISNNPSGIVTDSAKWHVNIFSGQIIFVNDINAQQGDDYKKLANMGILSLDKLLTSTNNATVISGNILFPSVSYKWNHKNAISMHLDLRANGIFRSSHTNISDLFSDVKTPDNLEDLKDENLKGVVNTWTEYNITYSRLLVENEKHILAGGITLKFLQGGGSGYFDMDGIDVSYDKDKIKHLEFDLTYAFNETLWDITEDGKIKFDGDEGFGANIGLSYFYKSTNQPHKPYLFKAGLSVRDIGYIRHKSDRGNKTYHVSMDDVPYSRFQGVETIEAFIDSVRSSVDFKEIRNGSYNLGLPTTFLLNVDYCHTPKLFLNATLNYQPSVYKNVVKSFKANFFKMTLTPRFENRTWGFYLPLAHQNYLGFSAGLAARWKSIFMGSTTLVSNIFKDDPDFSQFYFGFNIPIGKSN
ncbi:hypothetical protein E9993_02335 [Labilibacter sediminis]|nr:hypothetical protein E9993_02335 [Labilibacter sediminis]